jgi:fucose permease
MEVSNVSPTKTPGLEDMAPQFQEVPYRWVIIILYSLLAILIGIITVVLSPISTKIVAIYGVSDFTINATAMAYSLIFAVAGIPANYFIDDHGLRIGVNCQ